MGTKKIKKKKPKTKPAPAINQFDDLFSRQRTNEGFAVVDKETATKIVEDRTAADRKSAEENETEYDDSKKLKAVRSIPLEVIRTLFLDERDWNLRTATVGRMKHDPRVIFILSSLTGWTYAGLSDDPETGKNCVKENVNYVLPSLIAETITGATNPVLAKLPLDRRVPAYVSALGSDVTRVIDRAVKQAERERRRAEDEREENGEGVTDLASRRRKK